MPPRKNPAVTISTVTRNLVKIWPIRSPEPVPARNHVKIWPEAAAQLESLPVMITHHLEHCHTGGQPAVRESPLTRGRLCCS